jgi:hypothetical protein
MQEEDQGKRMGSIAARTSGHQMIAAKAVGI